MFKDFTGLVRSATTSHNVVPFAAEPPQPPVVEPTAEELELQSALELKSRLHELLLERLNLAVIDKVEPEDLRLV